MKHETPNSEPVSGTMCTTDGQHPSSSTNERAFLADRAADAKTAFGRTLRQMKDTLTGLAGVRSCAARHPWILTGSAVAAGVVAGAVLTPAARRRSRQLRQALSVSAADSSPACREHETPRAKKSFVWSIAGTVLAAVLRPLLQNMFAPPVAAQDEPPGDPL
jgi:uncharacterized membrane protein YidH (DUF202 family)